MQVVASACHKWHILLHDLMHPQGHGKVKARKSLKSICDDCFQTSMLVNDVMRADMPEILQDEYLILKHRHMYIDYFFLHSCAVMFKT